MKWYYLLPFVTVLISYLYARRYKKQNHPLYIIYVLFGISGLAALFVKYFLIDYFVDFDQIRSYHFLVYCGFMFLVLTPIFNGVRYRLNLNNFQIGKTTTYVLYIFSFLIYFSFFYQLPFAIKAMSLGALEVRDILNVEKKSILPTNIFTTIAVAVSSFYIVFSVFFYVLLVKSNNIFLKISMFVGSTLYVVSSLCFTARDGAVYYGLTMVFLLFIFSDYFNKERFRKIKRLTLMSSVLILGFLVTFTYQRFASDDLLKHSKASQSDLIIGGTLSYIGQQPYIFCQDLLEGGMNYGLSVRFPLISKLTGNYVEHKRDSPIHWTFGTFLKDFYDISGYNSLIFLSLAFTGFFYFLFKFLHLFNPIISLLTLTIYFQFMIQGVFYFRLGTWSGNIYFVMFFLLCCVIAIGYKLTMRTVKV